MSITNILNWICPKKKKKIKKTLLNKAANFDLIFSLQLFMPYAHDSVRLVHVSMYVICNTENNSLSFKKINKK